jgi:hypothetical protein
VITGGVGMKEQIGKVVAIPRVSYAFGDKRFRVLYGPENEKGERQIVGVVDDAYVGRVQALLDFADATMPKEDA